MGSASLGTTIVALAVVLVGCGGGAQPRWDQVGDAQPRTAPASIGCDGEQACERLAQGEISAFTCIERATALYGTDYVAGVLLMKGCMRRSDFRQIEVFKKRPWSAVRFSEKDHPLLLAVAMRRGAALAAEDLRALGVPATPVAEFLEQREQKSGALVIMRAEALTSVRGRRGAVSTVRLYDDTASCFRPSRGYVTRRAAAAELLGVTAEVTSRDVLPVGPRIELLCRYQEARSDELASAVSEIGAIGVDPGSLATVDEDPPPIVAFQLVASVPVDR